MKQTLGAIVLTGAMALGLGGCNNQEPVENTLDKSSPVNRTLVNVGDKAQIPGWQWIYVMDSEPYRDGSVESVTGGICGVETGGTIEVLGFTKDEKAIVEYTAPGNPIGTPCQSGVKYLVEPEEFVGLSAEYRAKIKAAGELKEDLQCILAGKSALKQIHVNDKVVKVGDKVRVSNNRRINVMNLSPIVQRYLNGSTMLHFQDNGDYETCFVGTNVDVTVLGFTKDGMALVEYTAPGNPMVTSCPSGTQYLVQPGKLVELIK